MKINKTILTVLLLIAAIAGGLWYMKDMRKRADSEGGRELVVYYRLLRNGVDSEEKRGELRACVDRLMDISERCNEKMSGELRSRCMDGEFILGNYEASVRLVEQQTGMSKEWKACVTAKLRAHAALVKGDNRTAIDQFKIFIDTVAADPDFKPQDDPVTDIEWTKAAVLANNYRRISVLAKQINADEESKGYLVKAKSLAKQAIAESEEYREEYLKEFADILDGWKPE